MLPTQYTVLAHSNCTQINITFLGKAVADTHTPCNYYDPAGLFRLASLFLRSLIVHSLSLSLSFMIGISRATVVIGGGGSSAGVLIGNNLSGLLSP